QNHLSTAAIQASNVNRQISAGVRHEKNLCNCSDNPSICTVGCARSGAHRRRGARCIVWSSRFGTCGRGSWCCDRLHRGAFYCSIMGTAEIIREPSQGTLSKSVRECSVQSRTIDSGGCDGRPVERGFGATLETFGAISPRPGRRDTACPDIGMIPV